MNALENLWDDAEAGGLSGCDLLVYRSRLLGSDRRITNFGGGNTSSKLVDTDPLTGDEVEVLWVKGSGGDVGTTGVEGFATLYMNKLEALKRLYRGPAHEDVAEAALFLVSDKAAKSTGNIINVDAGNAQSFTR